MVAITRPEGEPGAPSTGEVISDEELDEFLAPFGGEEAFLESERQFDANREYLEAHYDQLKERYPDQWVGIVRQQVLAHADSSEAVMDALEKTDENLGGMVLHHACVEEPVLIL